MSLTTRVTPGGAGINSGRGYKGLGEECPPRRAAGTIYRAPTQDDGGSGKNVKIPAHATRRALGFFLAIVRSFRAAWRGRRVPCSQLRTALGLTFR